MRLPRLAILLLATMVAGSPGSTAQEAAQLIAAPVVIGGNLDCFRAAPDLNGDGDKDAVSVWFQGPGAMRVAGWWNDGSGVFTPGWSITLPLTYSPPLSVTSQVEVHVAAGDLNGDGADDFAFALDNAIGWWISNGDLAVPSVPWVVSLPGPVRDLVIADFDQDGRADVAALTWQELRIYRTLGSAPPVLSSTLALPSNDGHRIVTAELSGDATPDVAILRIGHYEVHPVVAGVLQPGPTWPSYLTVTSGIAAGDVDGDGDADLVVSAGILGNQLTGPQLTIVVVRRTGPGTFVPETVQFKAPANAPPTMLVDVDLDGDRDLVGVLGGSTFSIGQPLTNDGSGGAIVWRNLGTGTFGSAQNWTLAGATGSIAIEDLDGDGDLDAIAGRCVAYAIPGRGVLTDPLPGNPGSLNAPEDWDRDGDPDLAPGISNGTSNVTTINDGNGSFTLTSVPSPAPAAGTTYLGPGYRGDFDGDGDVDLVVEHVNGTSMFQGFEMRLLRNAGGGGLVDGGAASPTGTTMRLVPTDGPNGSTYQFTLNDRNALVADVDGDQDLDVVTFYPPLDWAYSPEAGSKIWLNNGAGFFTPGSDLPGIRPTAAADLTGDGVPELAAMQRTGATSALVVLHGVGGGTFAPPSVLASGLPNVSGLDQPQLVDVDQDLDPDLLAAIQGNLTVFTNDGSGNLTSSAIGAIDPGPTTHVMRAGDLNGDGLTDVLASVSTGVRLWLRDPAGPGWLAPRDWSAGVGSLSDVDGDGDLDLLAFGLLNRNTTFSPPASGTRRQYGSGLAGSGGWIPVIGSAGVLRTGSSGEIRISNALGGAAGFLALGTSETSQPVFGGTLLVVPALIEAITLGGAPGVPGAGYLAIPWTLPPGLSGMEFFEQAAIVDPSATQGLSFTQAIRCLIGV